MARAEGYYDQRITQRLILQPRAELNFAAQSSREIGVGAGLSDAEVGFACATTSAASSRLMSASNIGGPSATPAASCATRARMPAAGAC